MAKTYEVGNVMWWGMTLLLIVDRVNTPGDTTWKCLILEPVPGWEALYPPGSLGYFRDTDFTERLA